MLLQFKSNSILIAPFRSVQSLGKLCLETKFAFVFLSFSNFKSTTAARMLILLSLSLSPAVSRLWLFRVVLWQIPFANRTTKLQAYTHSLKTDNKQESVEWSGDGKPLKQHATMMTMMTRRTTLRKKHLSSL